MTPKVEPSTTLSSSGLPLMPAADVSRGVQPSASASASPSSPSGSSQSVGTEPAMTQSMAVITTKNFISGIVGGGCEAVVGYPLETVKARMQTQQAGARVFSGPLDCLQKSVPEGGVGSLYRGASPQIFRSAVRCVDPHASPPP
jgi:hypothetical protein